MLKETIYTLISDGVDTFLFGSMSEFDNLSWSIVTQIKETHPFVKRVYVRSSSQYIEKSYEQYLLQFYEETYFPSGVGKAGKLAYVKRNYEMIDNSDYCIFYYSDNYQSSLIRNSGTKLAYDYAVKKKKVIINLCKAGSADCSLELKDQN